MHNYMERCIVLFAFIIPLLSVTLSEQPGRPPAENHCVKGLLLYETIIFFHLLRVCMDERVCESYLQRESLCKMDPNTSSVITLQQGNGKPQSRHQAGLQTIQTNEKTLTQTLTLTQADQMTWI